MSNNIIPPGPYCYSGFYICPFWGLRTKRVQGYEDYIGECSYYNVNDDESGTGESLLWDQVKCFQCEKDNYGEE